MSSLMSVSSSRRSAGASGGSGSSDLESQHGSPAPNVSASSVVGLARRMSPKLPPMSHSTLPGSASSTTTTSFTSSSSSSSSAAVNGLRQHGGAYVMNGAAATHPVFPSGLSSFSLLSSSTASTSSSSSSSSSSARYLVACLLLLGCVCLFSVGWDHSALIRTPSIVCFDGQTCVPAERSVSRTAAYTQPDSSHEADGAVTASHKDTASPINTAPAASKRGPPFYDSLSSLLACPPLASILAVNNLRAADDVSGTAVVIPANQPQLRSLINDYERSLNERLSAAQLTFDDWREAADGGGGSSGARLTMAQYYAQHAGVDLVTSSTRNTNYTISAWDNICLTFGGEKDPHLVFLGADVAAQQQLIDTQLLKPDHHQFSWVPPRWCNDQGRLTAQAKANNEWLWIPAEPNSATFHQFEWDFNVGHQFHQQVWPLFTATQPESPQLFGSPSITRLMIDSACRDDSSSAGVRHGAWKPINQFFGRIVLSGVRDRMSVMRQSCADGTLPSGVCFERLALNDGKDQYLDRGAAASFESFRRFRSLILRTLQLDPPPFPSPAALPSTPLRVTIYSRQDSSRRRIMNVAELTAALSPHHIVRHVPDFGQRPPHEQLALYANTDLLIAPHGAHMTFAFLLPTNAVVVEAFAHEEGKFSWTVNFLKGSHAHARTHQHAP